LNGNDGIFNVPYWDLLIGMDASIFPSYYEPWGYTPLESIAFSVPTITTDKSGFGQWIQDTFGIEHGIAVVHRSDYNYSQVAETIGNILFKFTQADQGYVEKIRQNALKTSKKALWDEFIQYYYQAYSIAIKNRNLRLNNK